MGWSSMWTDEYDQVDDGLYLHDPGMPLEVWVGELLGPEPIESKTGKVSHSWGIAGTEEWHEKEVTWWKDEWGTWHAVKNLYHPKYHTKGKLTVEAIQAVTKKLYDQAEKDMVFLTFADEVCIGPGKIVKFESHEKDLSDYVKEDAEHNHEE